MFYKLTSELCTNAVGTQQRGTQEAFTESVTFRMGLEWNLQVHQLKG
jgi:hypothetical protein